MAHILLTGCSNYKKRKVIDDPAGFCYDRTVSAWVSSTDGCLLVLNNDFPSVATKKEDVETGEDQKGQ